MSISVDALKKELEAISEGKKKKVMIKHAHLLTGCIVQDISTIINSVTCLNQLSTADDSLDWNEGTESCKKLADALRTGKKICTNETIVY